MPASGEEQLSLITHDEVLASNGNSNQFTARSSEDIDIQHGIVQVAHESQQELKTLPRLNFGCIFNIAIINVLICMDTVFPWAFGVFHVKGFDLS